MELIEVEAFAYWYDRKTYHDPTNDRMMELMMIQRWNLSWSN